MKAFNPISEGYQSEVAALDAFIEECLEKRNVQDLIRLNIYLRRYFSPSIIRDVFRRKMLPRLLKQEQCDTIAALVLDIRGFVRTTRSGERSSEGLDVVARLLRMFFSRTIRIAFEHYGMVGEFAGDRVLVTFGFPSQAVVGQSRSLKTDELALNAHRAVSTAFRIQQMCEEIKKDTQFPPSLRQFEVGIGICAGRPAWIGDIGSNHGSEEGDTWRQELTVISTAVNIAARAEELTKNDSLLGDAPEKKIIADEQVVNQIRQLSGNRELSLRELGLVDVRGLDEQARLFQLIDPQPEVMLIPEPITERDRMLVDWICEHIDGAIERDVFSKVHRSLSTIGQVIVDTATPDESTVFEQIAEQIITSFKATTMTLYRIDPSTQELVVMISKGPQPLRSGVTLEPGTGIVGHVAREGQVYMSPDVHTDPLWVGRNDIKFDQRIHSMMCVPLKAGRKIVGIVQVMDEQIGAFTHNDLISLNVFAGLATVALENARTYEQALHMTKARTLITNAFASSLTIKEVLDAVMVAIQETLGAKNATLYLIDHENGDLVFEKFITESKQPPKEGQRLAPGTGIVGRVIETKTPLLIRDTQNDPDWYGRIGSDMRSIICVPLLAQGQVVGAIQALDRSPEFFDQEHLEILNWLASSAAVAVNNAVQLKQTQDRLIASETIAGLGAISGKLAHNLKNYVGAIKTLANSLQRQLQNDDPKASEKIERIIRSADKAQIEVRSFMQPLTGWEPTNVDLDMVLDELVAEVAAERKSHQRLIEPQAQIGIQYHSFGQSLSMLAGKDQIKYIFRNLIDNAMRAIDEKDLPKGRRRRPKEGIILALAVERINESDWAVVTVRDTGPGIPPDILSRIFELSFTTRPEGTIGGYGLFWVRLNVERLGGRITATSQVGVGTTFHVRLPLQRAEQQR